MHAAAIKVLEEQLVTLEQVSVPNRHTITVYAAQLALKEIAEITKTIEFLKQQKD